VNIATNMPASTSLLPSISAARIESGQNHKGSTLVL
jgi:hypothetical protein